MLDDLDDDPAPVLLVTAHRRESCGRPLEQVGAALPELASVEPRLRIVIPLHRNPVLVMRDTTERPEGVAAGTTRLVGTDPAVIVPRCGVVPIGEVSSAGCGPPSRSRG